MLSPDGNFTLIEWGKYSQDIFNGKYQISYESKSEEYCFGDIIFTFATENKPYVNFYANKESKFILSENFLCIYDDSNKMRWNRKN